jgi:leader peptidase (prepilin peptidase) / N-methyltransferase
VVIAPGWAALAAALAGLATAVATKPVLLALPEPAEASKKPPYRALATTWFVLVASLLAAFTAVLSWYAVPIAALPAWMVIGTCGALLAMIDARTTWLPLRLIQASWLLMVGAVGLGWPLGGGWQLVARAAGGAAVAGALYLIVWLLTRGGFGFGDVRFAPLLGAAAAACSWRLLIWALALGTLVGGVNGLVRLVAKRPGGFPYAPSMLAGTYLAVVVDWLGG